MPSPLLISLLLLRPPALPPYSATVVDAATNEPLAGVSVQATEPAGATSTDERGGFTLAARPRSLGLTRLGYAPLRLTGPAESGGPDTLRLLPQAYALAEVAVRPPRAVVIAYAPGGGPELGRRLYPGQAVALLLERPATVPADQPCVVSEVRLLLRERPQQGRLRVRLVEVLPGPPDHPGTRDLLPTPAIFSTAQLTQARRGELLLDVSASGLLLSVAGLCVVIECLPTEPADEGAALAITHDGKGHPTITLTSSGAGTAPRLYAGDDFPLLTAGRGTGSGTWSYYPNRSTWTTRSAVSYTVRAEVRVLAY